ncbi:hypothetical protein HK100_006117 [Physocladia obscura]|uniref:TauD/TfdA-like domain-containing protein n=1 Tax=Physocladia obscura TaxID=109957 RepID=A0AAD5SQV5_9FUNG|nr:hypothetical protein HK100_006117 [Physocladia obscura]
MTVEEKPAATAVVDSTWTEEDIKREFPVDPTFTYVPSRHDWVERQFKNSAKHRGDALPAGFPQSVNRPSVWDGFETQNHPEKWLHYLTNDQNAALKVALDHWKSLTLPYHQLNRTTFPLPESFKAVTESWVDTLLNGLGFLQLRGFNIDDYSEEDAIIVYAGLASYVGDQRLRQGSYGTFFHVKADPNYGPVDISVPANETVEQVFHTDAIPGGNVVSFLAVGAAESGGDSTLASIGKVYNDIAKSRPDIVKVLADDWTLDIGNYFHGTPGRSQTRPLLFHENGRLLAAIARRSVTGYGIWGRHKSLPKITEEQKEALDTLHFLGRKHSLNIPIRRGDIQFLNNYEVFHAREAYTDGAENQRHLVRLFLRVDRIEWERSEHLKGTSSKDVDELAEEIWNLKPFAPVRIAA